MQIDKAIRAENLKEALEKFLGLAGETILRLDGAWNPNDGAPVFTVRGRYTAQGWTQWTEGFQYGCQLLQFDATGDEQFLAMGRENVLSRMAPHLTHMGVHDHGFNNVSTYGALWRLALEGRIDATGEARALYAMALKVSGAVQASRWSALNDGTGYMYSFNGPHSLFSDTIRSCRSLVLAHRLGHVLLGENDRKISLLQRAVQHLENTARYNMYYGEGRDAYDVPGRVAHESLFNTNDGNYRCPSTQQGYSPFTTWTRGLAWIMLGAAEQLECLATLPDSELDAVGGREAIEATLLRMARATCDFYIANTAADGVPYWDTGAPGLASMADHLALNSQPDNPYEPVDSSAAVIAAQGLLRLGKYLGVDTPDGSRYFCAGLTAARTLFSAPYLSDSAEHDGLILHSVYHRPNGWDYIPEGKKVPHGESTMWGDYHAMELAVYLQRENEGGPYLTFFGPEN